MLYLKVADLRHSKHMHVAVALGICSAHWWLKARAAYPGILNGKRNAEGVEVDVGRGVSLPKLVGSGEGALPLPRKFLEFHSRLDYILEHCKKLLTYLLAFE